MYGVYSFILKFHLLTETVEGLTALMWGRLSFSGFAGCSTGGAAGETNNFSHSQEQTHSGWHLQTPVVCPGWCAGLYQSMVSYILSSGETENASYINKKKGTIDKTKFYKGKHTARFIKAKLR